MKNIVVHLSPANIDITCTTFMVYAKRYQDAAERLMATTTEICGFDAVSYQLLCQALELHLKSFICLKDQIGHRKIKTKYGHDLRKLWRHAKMRGIKRYAATTKLRDDSISLVSPYYRDRKFTYLDLEMISRGYRSLKSKPRTRKTISKLNRQLEKSLRTPILSAA